MMSFGKRYFDIYRKTRYLSIFVTPLLAWILFIETYYNFYYFTEFPESNSIERQNELILSIVFQTIIFLLFVLRFIFYVLLSLNSFGSAKAFGY